VAQTQYDYSKRFQLRAVDAEGNDELLCSTPTLLEAAFAKGTYRLPGARYYILDHLTGNKCSVKKALHPDVIFQPMP
jgi:hypothetical protein